MVMTTLGFSKSPKRQLELSWAPKATEACPQCTNTGKLLRWRSLSAQGFNTESMVIDIFSPSTAHPVGWLS